MSGMSFSDLEPPGPPARGSEVESSLGNWYTEVRTTPIADLSVRDLARACRQQLCLAHVVPVALEELRSNVTAGYIFDGEMASTVARIPQAFWQGHRELADLAARILKAGLDRLDEDVREEVEDFLAQAYE